MDSVKPRAKPSFRLDLVWNLAAVLFVKARGLLLTLVLSRLLGAAGYGVWAQFGVAASLLSIIAGLGLYQSTIQFLPDAETAPARARVVWNAVGVVAMAGTGVALACGVFGGSVLRLVGHDNLGEYYARLAGLGAALLALRFVILNVFRAQNRLDLYSGLNIWFDASELCVVALVCWVFRSLEITVLALLATQLIGVVVQLGLLIRTFGAPVLPGPGLSAAFGYSLPLVLIQVFDGLLASSDRLLVGGFLGSAAAGIYAGMYALATIPAILNQALATVLLPRLVNDTKGSERVRKLSVTVTAVVGTVSALVMATFCRPLLQLLLGVHADALPPDIHWTMLSVASGVMLFTVGRILSLNLYATRRTGLAAVIWGVAAAANVALNWLLLPRLGMLAAGLSTLIGYALFLVPLVYLGRKNTG